MMKLAIIFLPIVFAVIWALFIGLRIIIFLPILFAVIWAAFIGLRINRVETRDGKRKLVNY